jgi:hypothetical protein
MWCFKKLCLLKNSRWVGSGAVKSQDGTEDRIHEGKTSYGSGTPLLVRIEDQSVGFGRLRHTVDRTLKMHGQVLLQILGMCTRLWNMLLSIFMSVPSLQVGDIWRNMFYSSSLQKRSGL